MPMTRLICFGSDIFSDNLVQVGVLQRRTGIFVALQIVYQFQESKLVNKKFSEFFSDIVFLLSSVASVVLQRLHTNLWLNLVS